MQTSPAWVSLLHGGRFLHVTVPVELCPNMGRVFKIVNAFYIVSRPACWTSRSGAFWWNASHVRRSRAWLVGLATRCPATFRQLLVFWATFIILGNFFNFEQLLVKKRVFLIFCCEKLCIWQINHRKYVLLKISLQVSLKNRLFDPISMIRPWNDTSHTTGLVFWAGNQYSVVSGKATQNSVWIQDGGQLWRFQQ